MDEPWAIATFVLNMFKTVVASRGSTPIVSHSYGNRSSFLHIRAAVVEAFVAFREESWLFIVRFSYGLVTIPVRLVTTRQQYVIQTPLGGVDLLTSDDTPSHLTQSRPPLAEYIIHNVAVTLRWL